MSEPATTLQQISVRAAVLRRLLRGERLDLAALPAEADLDAGAVSRALEALNASGAIYTADGAVIAAYPLSAVPTPHRVHLNGTAVYACCAIDALAVAAMANRAGTIESRCAYFFCGSDHLGRWRAERPRLAGDTLTLAQAVERALEIFRPAIELVRAAAGQGG